jgi:Zn-dependent metalloprotease
MLIRKLCRVSAAIALLGAAACGGAPDDPAPAPAPTPAGPDALTPELRRAVEASLDHLEAHAAVLGVRGRGDLRLVRAFTDELDLTHARFQQTIGGVPVFGGEGIVHLRRDRSIAAVTNAFVTDAAVSTTPALTADQAIDRAIDRAIGPGTCATCLAAPPAADLWVLRRDGRDHLVWRVQLRLHERTRRAALPVVFVDAHTGDVVWQYDNLQTGSGPSLYSGTVALDTTPSGGLYYMEDLARAFGAFAVRSGSRVRFDDDNDLWDAAAQRPGVDAHYGVAQALAYYRDVHGRDGIDGNGGPRTALAIDGATGLVSSYVLFGESYNNAYWDGSTMTFGDGDGVQFSPLVALDIVGHELTHGVTQYTAGLVYSGESGALNESYSDIFGALIERHARGDSDAIWKLGEDANPPAAAGDALRFMESPHQASNKGYTPDDDPDHYSERYLGGGDNGGVHINSGIPNKTFHLLAMGGTHHLGGSMTGIGPDKAAAIWYKALTAYMTSSASFARAARATYDAAIELYGAGSPEAGAVVSAWGLTGIAVDLAAPEATITAPTAGATVTAATTITAAATDNVGVSAVQFLIDGVVRGTDTTSPFTYTWSPVIADNGAHTIAAKAFDLAGNSSQSAAIGVTVACETVPPSVAVTAPAQGTTVAGSVSITADATDNVAVARVELYVDGAYQASDSSAPYSFTWSSLGVGNGPHAITARALDAVGNSATSAAVTVTVDNDRTAPTAAITAPTAGSTLAGVVDVYVDAADNVGVTRVELYVDGQLVATDTLWFWYMTWDTAAFGNGPHTLVAKAYDALNNVGASSPVAVTTSNAGQAAYDAALGAPRCATAGAACDTSYLVNGRAALGPELNAPNTLGGTCADGTSGTYHTSYSESLDRLRVSTSDGLPIAAGKTITIEATVWSRAQNSWDYDLLDLFYTSTPDAPSPVWTPIVTLYAGGTAGAQTLRTTFTLPPGTQHAIRGQLRYYENGSLSEPCYAYAYNDRDDLVFAAIDAPDAAPPATAITAPAAGASVQSTVWVNATATDDIGLAGVDLYVDGAKLATDTTAPYSILWNTTALGNGAHTLQTVARDLTGKTGQSAPITVTVANPDRTPPAVSITSPVDGEAVSGTRTVSIAASDPSGISAVYLYVDGAYVGSDTTSPYAIAWNTAGLPYGAHVLEARAHDTASNTGTSAPITVTVTAPDTTAPTTAITSPADGATVAGTIAVTTSTSDNVGVTSVELLLDGKVIATAAAAPWSVSWDTRATTNKAHALKTRARDAAGNLGTSATISVTVSNPRAAP